MDQTGHYGNEGHTEGFESTDVFPSDSVRGRHRPGRGRAVPGGGVEPGESDVEALVREMWEETGLTVEPGPLIGAVERPGAPGTVLDIRDYAATVTGGALRAGDG